MPEKYGRTTGSSIFHPKEGLRRLVHSLCQNYMNKHVLAYHNYLNKLQCYS